MELIPQNEVQALRLQGENNDQPPSPTPPLKRLCDTVLDHIGDKCCLGSKTLGALKMTPRLMTAIFLLGRLAIPLLYIRRDQTLNM